MVYSVTLTLGMGEKMKLGATIGTLLTIPRVFIRILNNVSRYRKVCGASRG